MGIRGSIEKGSKYLGSLDRKINLSKHCLSQRFSRVSSRPRNGRGMRQNSSHRLVLDLEKQGSKVSSLKWLRKRPKFRGIPRLILKKAEEKGKIPRLVSSSEKFYQRSRPWPRPRQITPWEPLLDKLFWGYCRNGTSCYLLLNLTQKYNNDDPFI